MSGTVNAEIRHGRIATDATYRDKELMRQVPGARYSDPGDGLGKTWHVPLAWAACVALRGVFGGRLAVGPTLWAWAGRESAMRRHAADLREAVDAPGHPDDRPYQRVGARFLVTARRATLADDMGTGKTRQVARALRDIGPDALPALVVCPRAVLAHWHREIGEVAPTLRVGLVRGNVTERRAVLAAVAAGEIDVAVLTWAGLRSHSRLAPYGSVRLERCERCEAGSTRKTTSCHACPRELNAIDWSTVVADEAHYAKDQTSQQTRALWAVAHGLDGPGRGATWRFALTGTPIADAVDDYWPIGHFLDADEYPTRTTFVDRYGLVSWNAFGGLDVVGIRADTRAEFDAFVLPRFLRRPKDLVLPYLPAKTPVTREVDLKPRQRKLYNELAKEMVGRLDDGDAILATNPLTLTGKLNRVACSMLSAETCDGCGGDRAAREGCRSCGGWGRRFVACDPSSKIDDLLALLDELGTEQVVVFAESRQLVELAARRLDKAKVSNVMYTGTISDAAREEAVREFGAGRARVFLGTIGAGGTGLDGLQVASVVVFLQRSYSHIANVQAEDRLHRSGQTGDRLLVVDIVAAGTVEDDKEAALAQKAGRFEELVRDRDTLRRLLEIRP